MCYFGEIKKHLNRKKDYVEFIRDEEDTIQFEVKYSKEPKENRFEKLFTICYIDSFSPEKESTRNLRMERPSGKYYWLMFNQENVWNQRYERFTEIIGMEWFKTEEEVIDEIKRLCRNWRR